MATTFASLSDEFSFDFHRSTRYFLVRGNSTTVTEGKHYKETSTLSAISRIQSQIHSTIPSNGPVTHASVFALYPLSASSLYCIDSW